MSRFMPELLAPAGSLDKLIVAVLYGADAVYLGGQKFGLRQAAENFTREELKEGVDFAHQHNSKVFVVLNSYFHQKDFDSLKDFLLYIESIKVDAVIVSDPGVIQFISEHTNLEIHLSTQASCLNVRAAKLWKSLGVTRVVLGREASIEDAARIKREAGLEVEMFVHGSMCMAYSGHCVISNYTQGRDSNRGGCAHSCRFEYSLSKDSADKGKDKEDLEKRKHSFFMSSKDLEGIRVLDKFIESEIDSLKVEGRMKSHLYAGTISKVYREALDYYEENGHFLSDNMANWESELRKITHRAYTEASLISPADDSSIYDEREHEDGLYTSIGSIREVSKSHGFMLLEVKSYFHPGEILEVLPFKGVPFEIEVTFVKSVSDKNLEKTKPGTLVKIPYYEGVERFNLVRRRNLQ